MSDLAPGWALGTHDLVWIEGPDAVAFADGQLSQDVASMHPGGVRRSLLLEPRGKLRALLWVLRGDERVGLATWAGTGERVAADLERFRFRVDALIEVDAGVGSSQWGTPPHAVGWAGDRSSLGIDLPAGSAPSAVAVGRPSEGTELDAEQVALHRIRAGEPLFGRDVDDDTIPQETGLVTEAVSFTKGCFVGQELVARIDSRGRVNRMLRRLTIRGLAPPSGASLAFGDVFVGTLGTVVPVDGGAEALAVVRREAAPGESVVVRWEGGEALAEVVEIARESLTP